MSLPLLLLSESTRLAAGPDLTRYLVVVGVLLGTLVAVGWVLRRLVAGSLRVRAAKRSLAVVDVLPLGGRQRLAVVRCYDRTFALGLGDKEVALVAELDPVQAGASPSPPERDFEALLESAHARIAGQRVPEAATGRTPVESAP